MAKKVPETRPFLNLDLKIFARIGFYLVIFASPFFRGLFFESELLPVLVAMAVVFCLTAFDKLIWGENQIYGGLGGGSRAFLAGPLDLAVLGLALAYGISLAVAVDFRTALSEFLRNLGYFMAYWVAAQLFSTPAGRRRLTQVIFLSAVGVAAIGLTSALGLFNFPGGYVEGRITSTFQYPNTMAAFMMVGSLLGCGLWASASRPRGRLIYPLGLALINLAILGSLSRGVWIVYPVFFLILLVGLRPQDRPRILFGQSVLITGSFLASRLLWSRAGAGGLPGLKGLFWIALAGLVALMAESLYSLASGWVRGQNWPRPVTRALGLAAGLYLLVAAGYYFWYASAALPSSLDQLVPDPVQTRAESIVPAAPAGRLVLFADALKIARDHPLIGTGGGGWNALYHRYQTSLDWTTEVHNHYLEVLVETGLIGLICLLAMVTWLGWKGWRQSGDPMVWTAIVASLALFVHSAADFDLSMPALALVLWSMMGTVSRAAPDQAGDAKVDNSPFRSAGLAVVITVVGVLVALPAYNLYRAGAFGAEGARAILAKEYAKAENLLEIARRLDPYAASYPFDLAQIHTALALASGDPERRERAREMAELAARVQPANLIVGMGLVDIYLWQGRMDDAARAADRLVENLPLGVMAYERSARAHVLAARAHLVLGDRSLAERHALAALDLDKQIADRLTRAGPNPKNWTGQKLSVTPSIRLSLGQAEYLLSRNEAAIGRLEPLIKDQGLGSEAVLWAAAALERTGQAERAQALLKPILEREPGTETEYRQILALKND